MRFVILLLVALLAFPSAASAVITFTQLDDDIFFVSHRVKFLGSRGQAQRLVYTKVASLCIAAGFSQFKILEQESAASQQYESANATIQTQFFHDDGDGRIECERNADEKYIEQARKKLAKTGYKPPTPPTEEPAAALDSPVTSRSCTVEQITAMVRTGMSDEQIKAACPD